MMSALQTPLLQYGADDGQMAPQAPQLLGSLPCTSVQTPLHVSFGHTQWLETQIVPPLHTVPQPPQLLLSLDVSMHVPLQFVVPRQSHDPL